MKAAVFVFALAVLPLAQSQNGAVSGDVRDTTGGVIPGVSISLTSDATSATSTTLTNARGQFRFQNLAGGAYEISASQAGFRSTRRRIRIGADATATANFDLQIGMLSETVTLVAAGTPATRPASGMPLPRRPAVDPPSQDPVRPPADPSAPIRVGGSIAEPKKVRDVRPVYPAEAQANGETGVVMLSATVDRDGAVKNITVLRSVSPALDRAAAGAVQEWRYTPTRLNGVAVDVEMAVTFSFQLR